MDVMECRPVGVAAMSRTVNHWTLLNRDDAGRPGIELEETAIDWEHWRFHDDDQLRRFIIHLITFHLNGKMPDPRDVNRG